MTFNVPNRGPLKRNERQASCRGVLDSCVGAGMPLEADPFFHTLELLTLCLTTPSIFSPYSGNEEEELSVHYCIMPSQNS